MSGKVSVTWRGTASPAAGGRCFLAYIKPAGAVSGKALQDPTPSNGDDTVDYSFIAALRNADRTKPLTR